MVEVGLKDLKISSPMLDFEMIGAHPRKIAAGPLEIELTLHFYGDDEQKAHFHHILKEAMQSGRLCLAKVIPTEIVNNDASEVIEKESVEKLYASKEIW